MVDTTKYPQGSTVLLVAMTILLKFLTDVDAFDVSKPKVESSVAIQFQVPRRPFVIAGILGLVGGVASRNLDQDFKDASTTSILDNKPEWSGTNLPRLSLDEAYERSIVHETFDFAHWPDPILRQSTSRISLTQYQREDPSSLHKIRRIAQVLERTAQKEGAVGLAAQQCGIDLSLVYLEQKAARENLFLFNPRIVSRSPETEMKVWTEQCLVLPPDFRATLLRDRTVEVEYECVTSYDLDDAAFVGKTKRRKLGGELARAVQHEMDHDRGILIVDHIDLVEMMPGMREIERNGHGDRMMLAFSRNTETDLNTSL